MMEDKKANTVAVSTVIILIIVIIVAHAFLKHSKAFFLITGADVAVILAVFACLFIRQRYNRSSRLLEKRLVSELGRELRVEYSFLRKVAGIPIKFRFQELEEATGHFQSLVGQGASASVFKGILKDGTCVAVKRIREEERGDKEFKSEVAAIASVQHVNLVRLVGYCMVPGGPRFLVYDFIPNGSLDCWIFSRGEKGNQPRGCLSWELRCSVAIDVAKALSYLHHDCRSRILHLDVKPENILLDESYRAIVADFGLSKLMGKDESKVITNIRGTRGYLAPEWLLELGISEKCDVYSYGMVLLELIGGQRNVRLIQNGNDMSQRKWQYFPKIVNQKIREGKMMEVLDPRLLESGGNNIDEREVKKLLHVAFWCIQESASMRPSMALVVEMLEGRVAIEEPPDTRMVIVDLLSIDQDSVDCPHGKPNMATLLAQPVESSTPANPNPSYSVTVSVLSAR